MASPTTETITLHASDGHRLEACRITPAEPARGAVVIVQEVFGVNAHIRSVARQYAAAGYVAIAPALFDRLQPGLTVPYTDIPRGRSLKQQCSNDNALLDLRAAVDAAEGAGPVAMVGYCWGGTLAFQAAQAWPLAAAIVYYGGNLPQYLGPELRCPMMFHFGERDAGIPRSDIELVRRAHPGEAYYLYPADHGFNCDERAAYDAESAALALQRSLDFLRHQVG